MAEMCAECGATFGDPAELIEHRRKAHPPGTPEDPDMNPAGHEPGFTCILCGAWFRTPEELAGHNARPHGRMFGRRFGRPRGA